MADDFTTYCLGVGCMTKCETCQHEKNWQMLNQMDNALRLPMQARMKSMNTTMCQITSGRFYLSTAETKEGGGDV